MLQTSQKPTQDNGKIDPRITRLGPRSRPHRLQMIDGRSVEGQLMNRLRADLRRHVGGKPSVVQQLIISRVCTLALRIELADRENLEQGDMTSRMSREYLSHIGTMARLLKLLGLEGAKASPPSLSDYLAGKSGAHQGAPQAPAAAGRSNGRPQTPSDTQRDPGRGNGHADASSNGFKHSEAVRARWRARRLREKQARQAGV